MASRMKQTIVRRPSLPLTASDEADLTLLRNATPYQRALARLSSQDITDGSEITESVLLHAVFEAGLAAVRQLAEAEGYEQMVADDATRRRLSRRRRPSWADER